MVRPYSNKYSRLPLPAEQPLAFRCLPEYFLEDVIDNFKYIFRNMPHIVISTQVDELVMLCITFLRSSEYVKNPYLKSNLVQILYTGVWPQHHRQNGILGDVINSHSFATQHLLHAILKFYIEVENTGTHTQFFDKFNIRYEIFQIIRSMWKNPTYREELRTEALVNSDFFVRFVNLLLNDVTFVLDESITNLIKIHDLQKELKPDKVLGMEATVKTEKEEALATAERSATSYMQLTNETVSMLKLFTEDLATSFTMPEIVQRLADMLDYNLDALVGPKCTNLIVENAKQYNFNPKVLLPEIIDVFLNLRNKPTFVEAVARDGRSYKPANIKRATDIMKNSLLKPPEEIRTWEALGEAFRIAKEVDDLGEEELGEIPEEFEGKIVLFHAGKMCQPCFSH
jgi:ubiquitin conjugation factor E4 B